MTDTAVYTIKSAFISSEPIEDFQLVLFAPCGQFLFVLLIPTSLILTLVFHPAFFVPIWHIHPHEGTYMVSSVPSIEVIPLSNHQTHVSLSSGVLHGS